MDCRTLNTIFDPTSEPVAAVDEHLRECPACQRYVDEVRRLSSLLASDAPVAVPADFNARLHQRLARVRRNPLQWWRFVNLRYALPMVAMVIVAVTTLKLLDRSTDVSHPAATSPVAEVAEGASGSAGAEEPRSMGAEDFSLALQPPSPLAPQPSSSLALQPSGSLAGVRGVSTEPPQIILRIRDELTRQERLVTIPSVVFGAEPVFASTRSTSPDSENVY